MDKSGAQWSVPPEYLAYLVSRQATSSSSRTICSAKTVRVAQHNREEKRGADWNEKKSEQEAAQSMRIDSICYHQGERHTRCVLTPRVYILDPSRNQFCCLMSAAFLAHATTTRNRPAFLPKLNSNFALHDSSELLTTLSQRVDSS